jgi:glycosyltransferase involved in cell wall biosynthesis
MKSVFAQTYPHFQVCVNDNASGDETATVVRELAKADPRVKYYCHPENIGVFKNFVYGMEHDRCDRLCDAEQRYGLGVGLFPAPPPDGSQQPFFFLLGPAAPLWLHGTKLTDPFIEGDEFLAELLEAPKLGDLLLRFAQRGGVRKALRHGLASHSSG